MPGAACPGVPPTGPPGLGQVVGGQRAHQLMLLLQLGLPVLAPLVPQLQLSHQGLALLAQSLLVFDQLQPGVEVRLLPCEARRPSLPSPRRPAHQILSLALPPGLREDPESWGAHTWTRATAAQASIPLGPGWCQQRSDSASALATRPRLWPHQELPGTGVILSTPSPGLWRRACPLPAKVSPQSPQDSTQPRGGLQADPSFADTYGRQAECS